MGLTAEEYRGNIQQCGDVTQITGQMMEDKRRVRAETAGGTATPTRCLSGKTCPTKNSLTKIEMRDQKGYV